MTPAAASARGTGGRHPGLLPTCARNAAQVPATAPGPASLGSVASETPHYGGHEAWGRGRAGGWPALAPALGTVPASSATPSTPQVVLVEDSGWPPFHRRGVQLTGYMWPGLLAQPPPATHCGCG